ncbi:MAG TPA: winged helix DNA-binding domain-containing protein [Candidatus Binatia bacterium]|nr:winged helix DNA-binding domain-containing protein [Candidatus Binatia bacterium]
MAALPTIDNAERRRRIGARHALAKRRPVQELPALADDLAGIHATDPASVYLELRARLESLTKGDIERALYEDRSIVKLVGMRRTMFAVSPAFGGIVNAATAMDIAAGERTRMYRMLAGAGITDAPVSWVAEVERQTVDALDELGEATAADLTKRVPGLREQIAFGEGKRWAGKVGVSTRLLFLLSAEARIVRGRPRGTWLSSLYRWVPTDRWIDSGLEPWPPEQAHAELVRRWLRAYGPGTTKDLQWWTGWTVACTKAALRAAEAVEVGLEGGARGWVLPDDLDPTPDPGPWVALLPALDSTVMAWKERDWYLGGFSRELFDTAGNAGPTAWVDGEVVGLWAQRSNLVVGYRLLRDVGREARLALDAEAARLTEWLGTDRVFPRFPTEAFRELSAT